jgi:PAS domain S-box-containing protein
VDRSRHFNNDLVRLFDLSLDAFCIAGFDGYLKLANPAFARMLGYTREELLAKPFIAHVHRDDRESVGIVLAQLAAGKDVAGFECRQLRADGSVCWLEWYTRTHPEERVVYGVGRDVTDRRVANDELRALRHVATLVAERVEPQDLFAVVAEEVARVVSVPVVSVARYELDNTASDCANFPPDGAGATGKRWSLEGTNALALVRASSVAARIDDYSRLEGEIADAARRTGIRSTVGTPILVEGRLWGAMVVSSRGEDPLPEGTEARLADFTELLATAIANAESRQRLGRLAEEQAALRRVATLVARGVRPAEIFSAVSKEVDRLFGLDEATVGRFDPEGPAFVVVGVAKSVEGIPIGSRWELNDLYVSSKVFLTGRSARVDASDLASVGGPVAAWHRRQGFISQVASPIIVDGRLWGAMTVVAKDETLPLDTDERLEKFAELVATAIANAENRSELAASRARIVAAGDEERRRVVRDLHDGAQQRLVHTVVTLKMARHALARDRQDAFPLVSEALQHAETATDELRELAHGILPSVLAHGGLHAGVRALASRMSIPVDVEMMVGRMPHTVEATAYFVVAEALTNVAKHSRAHRAMVSARMENHTLRVEVSDDGVGGARTDGSGLVGLSDRLAVLDGRLRVDSPSHGGTRIAAAIPVG